jgi:hypothetical protein
MTGTIPSGLKNLKGKIRPINQKKKKTRNAKACFHDYEFGIPFS